MTPSPHLPRKWLWCLRLFKNPSLDVSVYIPNPPHMALVMGWVVLFVPKSPTVETSLWSLSVSPHTYQFLSPVTRPCMIVIWLQKPRVELLSCTIGPTEHPKFHIDVFLTLWNAVMAMEVPLRHCICEEVSTMHCAPQACPYPCSCIPAEWIPVQISGKSYVFGRFLWLQCIRAPNEDLFPLEFRLKVLFILLVP